MPYIDADDRTAGLEPALTVITPGELNYQISRIIDRYMGNCPACYDTINEVIGVLECAKLEVYRRLAAPYEDVKKGTNGDVYTVAAKYEHPLNRRRGA